VIQTHWFYERARGQYVNQQANLSPAEKKKFLVQNPKSQMFTKTDLAKFVRTFDGLPHEVSEGAQKNFSRFAGDLGKQWDKNEGHDFTELWFKRLIGQAIMFRHLDSKVLRADWYTGYKANIVTYTLAKLAHMVSERYVHLDFLKLWNMQNVPDCLDAQMMDVAQKVNELILNPPADATSNKSEWAKREACWNAVRSCKLELHSTLDDYLIDDDQNKELEEEAGRDDLIQDGVKTQTTVFEKGPDYWVLLREWNDKNRKLISKEVDILNIACSMPRRIPSEKQAQILIAAENRAKVEGFFPG
jgi:hypothetical protein